MIDVCVFMYRSVNWCFVLCVDELPSQGVGGLKMYRDIDGKSSQASQKDLQSMGWQYWIFSWLFLLHLLWAF